MNLLVLLVALARACVAISAVGPRLLLVADDESAFRSDYSRLLSSLETRQFKVDIRNVKDTSFLLANHDVLNYDHLLVMVDKTRALGPRLDTMQLRKFLELEGNIMAVTSTSTAPESVREFASELDIAVPARGFRYIDHFGGESITSGADSILRLNSLNYKTPSVVQGPREKALYYSGTGAYLGSNPYTIPLLTSSSLTGYVYDTREGGDSVWTAGRQVTLAAGFQSRKNARFVWFGSLAALSDAGFRYSDSINEGLARNLTAWAFQEAGVIKSTNVRHFEPDTHRQGNQRDSSHNLSEIPDLYRVGRDIRYEINLSSWNSDTGHWGPSRLKDVQMEFVMLDPYYRLKLPQTKDSSNATTYGITFRAPDQHGMFTFRTEYLRPGLSFVTEKHLVTMRHMANDEWPRSFAIPNAWMYMTSVFSVAGVWLVFVACYLYGDGSRMQLK